MAASSSSAPHSTAVAVVFGLILVYLVFYIWGGTASMKYGEVNTPLSEVINQEYLGQLQKAGVIRLASNYDNMFLGATTVTMRAHSFDLDDQNLDKLESIAFQVTLTDGNQGPILVVRERSNHQRVSFEAMQRYLESNLDEALVAARERNATAGTWTTSR